MIARSGNDTVIGFIPGADIDEGTGSHAGGLTKARDAFQSAMSWTGKPALGSYTYPSGGKSEGWDFARAQGAGPMSYRSYAIPSGHTPADVHAGVCDQIWSARAADMVAAGFGEGWFAPGYEGNGKNFNGAAGQVGVAEWAYAVSRQIRVMRTVPGWDNWVSINFTATAARKNGLDPVAAYGLITEPFQSVGLDLYPQDDYSGAWSAADDPVTTWQFMLEQLNDQQVIAARYGLPLDIGEWGPMCRADGHATNGDLFTIAQLAHWVYDNDVSALWIFNGSNLPGDTCRFAAWSGTAYAPISTLAGQTPPIPRVTTWAAIKALFDPARFVGRPPSTSAQLAAMSAQLDQVKASRQGLQLAVAGISTAVGPVLYNVAQLGGSLRTLTDAIGVATPTPPTTGGTA